MVLRMTQGPTVMMNRSWLLKLFSLLDTDLGLEGRFVSMGDFYNSWLSAMRPTHWSSDDENVIITAANQKRLWAMTEVFILSMQLCGVVEVAWRLFSVRRRTWLRWSVSSTTKPLRTYTQILLTGQQYYKEMLTTDRPTNQPPKWARE